MQYFKNPWTPFVFDSQFIKLPIAKGMSYNLTALRPDWMTYLLSRLTKLQTKDEYFIDIGANLGQTLINYSKVSPEKKYVGFEPDVYCSVYLKRLVELNKFDNCLIIPIGISEENKLLKLYSASPTDCGATFREQLRPSRRLFSSIVPTILLDDAVHQLDLKPVSLIKIDVEGWELEVLKGMSNILQEYRPTIICEIIFRDSNAPLAEHQERSLELTSILDKFQYVIFQLIKSPDLQRVEGLKKIKIFSEEIWSVENKDLCDYLLVPQDRIKQILSTLDI
ncbi:MAG: FkbM family methyltransferase [Cyanobacteria bacterium J06621_8]